MSPSPRPRIAVVHPYWTLWEHIAGPTFRADRFELARAVARDLEDALESIAVADFTSAEEAAALAGLYVVRTSVGPVRLDSAAVVETYKRLAAVERDFRMLKGAEPFTSGPERPRGGGAHV